MAAITTSTTVDRDLPNGRTVRITGYLSLGGNKLFRIEYAGKAGCVAHDLFVIDKAKARTLLMQQGVVIISDSAWRGIIDAVDEVPSFAAAPLIERPGWTGPYFAEKGGKVYSPKGSPKGIAIFKRSGTAKTINGTHRNWLVQVAQHLTGQNLPMLAVLMALAAPLLEIIGETQNVGFEFCGPPETGKTTCLRLMASIAGNPALLPSFNATKLGLEGMFVAHNCLPFVVDEANLVSRGDSQFLADFAFHMSLGTTRVTAHQPVLVKYRFVFATTANDPFYSGLRAFAADTASAALQRLIPLLVPRDNPFGVFDHLSSGFSTSGAMASYLSQAIGEQYGTPMRKMLRAVVKLRASDPDRLKNGLLRRIHAFEAAVGIATTVRGKSRIATAFGLLFAAGEFAKAHGILPANWDCMAACIAGYRNYLTQLPHHTPLAARLLAIAQRPETLDLRGRALPELSDDDLHRHGAFLNKGVSGRIELLFTDAIRRQFFPDWNTLRQSAEFRASNLSGRDRRTTQRQVRQGRRKERFIAFVLPVDHELHPQK